MNPSCSPTVMTSKAIAIDAAMQPGTASTTLVFGDTTSLVYALVLWHRRRDGSRPDAARRPLTGSRPELCGPKHSAGRLLELCVHHQCLCEQRIGIGVVVAKSRLQQFGVVAIKTQRGLAITAAEQDVRESEGLKLLDLRIKIDRVLHQPLRVIEIAAG